MYKPLQIDAPKIVTQKNPPLNRSSEYKPPGGLYLEFALQYKVKQSKNGKFPSDYKLAQSILKCTFPPMHKPLKKAFEKYKLRGLFSEFYGILLTSLLSLSNLLKVAGYREEYRHKI